LHLPFLHVFFPFLLLLAVIVFSAVAELIAY
jgi:hypothetical protein